ncbi:MAG TPA: LytTR family DNA-binding domain-containing protein [Flavobacterium sp.]|jgi:two-component system LytT family response regulator
MITAVLIDDDQHLRAGLKSLLALYANDIHIIGEAESVKSGVALLQNLQPEVIFLDIHLADGTGFDILEQMAKIKGKSTAHLIFITAHEQYAVKAFKFSALDYILKPVGPEELQDTIAKIKTVAGKSSSFEHIDLLLENIRRKVDNYKRIALSTSDGIHLFEVADIIRCEAKVNYTEFFIKNHKPILISRTLKEYEELLTEHGFERIHQSHLINLSYLKSYIKSDGGYVIMADNTKIPLALSKKEKLQQLIKAL